MPAPALTADQKAAIREKRAKEDALRHYVPHPTQKRCLESKARYRLLDGPNRGGKSAHGAYELAAAARRLHPTKSVHSQDGVYLLMAPSREQLKDPWGKKLLHASELLGDYANKPLIPAWEIKKVWYTHGAGEPVPRDIVLKNGHKILLAVSGDPDIGKRLKGKKLLGVVLDEDAGTEELLAELYSRLLDANSDPKILEEAGGGWILWPATDDEGNPAFANFRRLCRAEDRTDHAEFTILPGDNPAISSDEREKLRGVLDDETYAVKHEGASTSNSLLIWQNWSRERHIRKTPYEIGIDDNLWVAFDPGWKHPCGILCFAMNRMAPQKLRIVRYYNYKYGTRSDHLNSIAEWLDGRWIEGIVCDPAIRKTESNGISYMTSFAEEIPDHGIKMRRPLMLGRNRNEDMFPQIEAYFENDLIEIDPFGDGCGKAIDEIEKYRWDPHAYRKIYRKAKGGDECNDCIKYIVSKLPFWQDAGPNLPKGVTSAPSVVHGPILDSPVIFASEEDRMHAQRMRESMSMMDENPILGVDDVGVLSY